MTPNKTPYWFPQHGWYFISLLHRVAFTASGCFSVGSKSMSLQTIRVKLFNGRQFVCETQRPEFNRYQALCLSTKINFLPENKLVSIIKLDNFDGLYDRHMRQPPIFDRICREALYFIADAAKPTASYSGIELEEPQVKALKEYFRTLPAIRQVIVESTVVILRK